MGQITNEDILNRINEERKATGFRTLSELTLLVDRKNTIYDLFSVLISREVRIGTGNIFYPNVVIDVKNNGYVHIEDNNMFFPGAHVEGNIGGVTIGNSNLFGEGGVYIKANRKGAKITVGNNGRYGHGAEVVGRSYLGSGSQILGPILVKDCILHEGESYQCADSAERGAILKGHGTATNIFLARGCVINGQGVFRPHSRQTRISYI